MNKKIKESNNLYKVLSLVIIIIVFFGNGCCFPGDSFVPANINGRMIDNSGDPLENEKVIIIVPLYGEEVYSDLFTDQKGNFSCTIANSDPGICCVVPPIGCIPPARKPYFLILAPNISANRYLIEFPWGGFKYKKIEKSTSSQNITGHRAGELEISGILCENEHNWIIDLEILVLQRYKRFQ